MVKISALLEYFKIIIGLNNYYVKAAYDRLLYHYIDKNYQYKILANAKKAKSTSFWLFGWKAQLADFDACAILDVGV